MCVCVCVCIHISGRLFFYNILPKNLNELSSQTYWSGRPCPPPGDLLKPGTEPASLKSPEWQAGSLPLVPPGINYI